MNEGSFDRQLAEVKRRQDLIGIGYPLTIDYAERMAKLAALTGDGDTARSYADLARTRREGGAA